MSGLHVLHVLKRTCITDSLSVRRQFARFFVMKQSTGDLISMVTLLGLCLISGHVEAKLTATDYIVRVTSECPTHPNGTAHVQVLTDVANAYPYVVCYNHTVHDMVKQKMDTWTQDVVFQSDDVSGECVFNRKDNSQTYIMYVFVPITSSLILGSEAPHVITCTYDDHSEKDGIPSEMGENKRPIRVVVENLGPLSKSGIELRVLDIAGQIVTGWVRLGKTLQLHARLVNSGDYADEVSLQAVSCKAIGQQSSYYILLAGCGDGKVFPKEYGFLTNGTTAISPYFHAFRLPGTKSMSFACNFVICKTKCDDTSCGARSRP